MYDVIYRYHIYVIIPTYYNSGTQTSTFADWPRVNSWLFLWFYRMFIIFNSLRSKWMQNSSYYDLKWARFRVHVIGEIYIENLYIWRIESFCIVMQIWLWHTCMSKTWSRFKLKYFKFCFFHVSSFKFFYGWPKCWCQMLGNQLDTKPRLLLCLPDLCHVFIDKGNILLHWKDFI